MTKKTKILLALLLPCLILFYNGICFSLLIFEPVSYHAPNLKNYQYSFDLYQNYSEDKNPAFYIKQITADDIAVSSDDCCLKYIANTALLIAEDSVDFSDMEQYIQSLEAEICGYIAPAHFYQISFSDISFDELQNKCFDITNSDFAKIAIPDYFEETPEDSFAEIIADTAETSYNIIHLEEAWSAAQNAEIENVQIGMIDVLVDDSNPNLTVANSDMYSEFHLFDTILAQASHGTHVAGILGASLSCESPGVLPDAQLYSYNGLNNSISYWIAALTDMIVTYQIKAINISMGYNEFIPVSATLGSQTAITYIERENSFFEAFLKNLITAGYDFLLCIAAGNETGTSLFRDYASYFGYSEKEWLRKTDIFHLYSSRPDFCDAQYGFFLSAIKDAAVRNHIIIVGSCNSDMIYSRFANAGSAVDIVAPGENIYSTSLRNTYEFNSGTSMAAPYVTGTAALLFALDSSLTAAQVKQILLDTSTETIPAYDFSYPLLNAGKAAKYVMQAAS